jgi:hypothetical protein
MRFLVDYWNNCQATRTKIVDVADEKLIPFALKRQDKRFTKVKKVKPLDIPQGGTDGATGEQPQTGGDQLAATGTGAGDQERSGLSGAVNTAPTFLQFGQNEDFRALPGASKGDAGNSK